MDQVTGAKALHLRSMVCGQPEDSKWRSRRGRGGWAEGTEGIVPLLGCYDWSEGGHKRGGGKGHLGPMLCLGCPMGKGIMFWPRRRRAGAKWLTVRPLMPNLDRVVKIYPRDGIKVYRVTLVVFLQNLHISVSLIQFSFQIRPYIGLTPLIMS